MKNKLSQFLSEIYLPLLIALGLSYPQLYFMSKVIDLERTANSQQAIELNKEIKNLYKDAQDLRVKSKEYIVKLDEIKKSKDSNSAKQTIEIQTAFNKQFSDLEQREKILREKSNAIQAKQNKIEWISRNQIFLQVSCFLLLFFAFNRSKDDNYNKGLMTGTITTCILYSIFILILISQIPK